MNTKYRVKHQMTVQLGGLNGYGTAKATSKIIGQLRLTDPNVSFKHDGTDDIGNYVTFYWETLEEFDV